MFLMRLKRISKNIIYMVDDGVDDGACHHYEIVNKIVNISVMVSGTRGASIGEG